MTVQQRFWVCLWMPVVIVGFILVSCAVPKIVDKVTKRSPIALKIDAKVRQIHTNAISINFSEAAPVVPTVVKEWLWWDQTAFGTNVTQWPLFIPSAGGQQVTVMFNVIYSTNLTVWMTYTNVDRPPVKIPVNLKQAYWNVGHQDL